MWNDKSGKGIFCCCRRKSTFKRWNEEFEREREWEKIKRISNNEILCTRKILFCLVKLGHLNLSFWEMQRRTFNKCTETEMRMGPPIELIIKSRYEKKCISCNSPNASANSMAHKSRELIIKYSGLWERTAKEMVDHWNFQGNSFLIIALQAHARALAFAFKPFDLRLWSAAKSGQFYFSSLLFYFVFVSVQWDPSVVTNPNWLSLQICTNVQCTEYRIWSTAIEQQARTNQLNGGMIANTT